jgi:phage head maturation protease
MDMQPSSIHLLLLSVLSFIEEIAPGAFDDCLNDDDSFNHDPNYILARSKEGKGTLKLEVDATGLKYSYDSPKRSYANDLLDA